MPTTQILVYCNEVRESPLLEWLSSLRARQPSAHARCLARILDLRRDGHALRRPLADYLRDGIRELRSRHGNVQYRILYSFVGKDIAVLTHGITKKSDVPDAEIELAMRYLQRVRAQPAKYTMEFTE